jgi:hypothetical protein
LNFKPKSNSNQPVSKEIIFDGKESPPTELGLLFNMNILQFVHRKLLAFLLSIKARLIMPNGQRATPSIEHIP